MCSSGPDGNLRACDSLIIMYFDDQISIFSAPSRLHITRFSFKDLHTYKIGFKTIYFLLDILVVRPRYFCIVWKDKKLESSESKSRGVQK